jgi:hypothetical protein
MSINIDDRPIDASRAVCGYDLSNLPQIVLVIVAVITHLIDNLAKGARELFGRVIGV